MAALRGGLGLLAVIFLVLSVTLVLGVKPRFRRVQHHHKVAQDAKACNGASGSADTPGKCGQTKPGGSFCGSDIDPGKYMMDPTCSDSGDPSWECCFKMPLVKRETTDEHPACSVGGVAGTCGESPSKCTNGQVTQGGCPNVSFGGLCCVPTSPGDVPQWADHAADSMPDPAIGGGGGSF